MFQQVKIPILGIVENMAGFTPPGSDEIFHIFGEGGGTSAAEEFELPMLGQIPIRKILEKQWTMELFTLMIISILLRH